jgi:hypothetical protein
MKLFTTALTFLLLASVAFAQPALPPKSYPPLPPKEAQIDEPAPPVYESAYMNVMNNAAKRGKIAVIFVGHDGTVLGRNLGNGNLISGRVDSVEDYPAKCIIISEPNPDSGWMKWKATLRANATDDEFREAITGRTVSLPASPFLPSSNLRPGEVRIADADKTWPVGLSFLNDLEPYTSATMTQQSLRRWSGVIVPVSRDSLELKWRVPGHLAGVRGWSSTLYRSRNLKPSTYLVRQDPDDGNSAVTWDRTYPEGFVHADVLRNADGKPFEVRVAEMIDGRWNRYIARSDPSARPLGYHPPTRKQCVECHSVAGRGEYSGAAIPGGGGVLSDPIPVIERGESVQGGFGTRL